MILFSLYLADDFCLKLKNELITFYFTLCDCRIKIDNLYKANVFIVAFKIISRRFFVQCIIVEILSIRKVENDLFF